MMIGKIFITSSGYDPQLGKHVKDPYLGPKASLGACRPDIRRQVKEGNHLFVISGKLPNVRQFVMGGFEVAQKIDAIQAYERFPDQRLRMRDDGQLTGNVVVDASGAQHELDTHDPATFGKRTPNYIVGTDCISLVDPAEIALGREQTLDMLREIFKKSGGSPFEIVGHYGSKLTEDQVIKLREWLLSLKKVTEAV
ncbi:DUF3656 domain-containing protein [Bradyrhizobium cytisi]|uniref:DUF3656 domain-containing protein n=1 Tax=Bradyrhizobium cytisi TaxID=515489 RepID=A0A5S4WVV2_9BRAD|nr:DUF3656 domain-containing protein [Bradyrhizobium cytisi]TYL86109.1 DUF3656 domain-containing protein [Bradyrhizobium cytisi]